MLLSLDKCSKRLNMSSEKIKIRVTPDIDATVASYKGEVYVHLSTNKKKWKSITLKTIEWEKLCRKQPKVKVAIGKVVKHVKKVANKNKLKKDSKKMGRTTASISSGEETDEENNSEMSEMESD